MLGASHTALLISDGCRQADFLILLLRGQLKLGQVTWCPWLSLLVTEGVRVRTQVHLTWKPMFSALWTLTSISSCGRSFQAACSPLSSE